MTDSEILLGLPQYEVTAIERSGRTITISARYTGPITCPNCGGSHLRNKGWCRRKVRHDDWGFRRGTLDLKVRKSRCLDCGRSFRQRLPGVQPCQRASESFQEMVYQQHLDGINRSCLGRRKGIGAATVLHQGGRCLTSIATARQGQHERARSRGQRGQSGSSPPPAAATV